MRAAPRGLVDGRRRGWLALALALALVPAGCGRESEPAPPALRLLDLVREAEVRWPRGAGVRPALPGPAGVARAQRKRMGRVAMVRAELDADERLALLAPVGSRYRYTLVAPQGARLDLGLGYLPTASGAGLQLRFRVSAGAPGKQHRLLLDERVVMAERDGWRDRTLALPETADGRLELDLEVVAVDDESVPPSAAVGDGPVLDGGGKGAPERDSGGSPSRDGGPSEPADAPRVWAAWSAPEIRGAGSEPGWDVVLISLDTLRADHLGCYGYERPTSPEIDAFAARSLRFETAVATSPWTRPSHFSLLTGLYPLSHEGMKPAPLAKVLRRAGYRTAALTGGGQMDYRIGFPEGFDEYRVQDWIREPERVHEWLDRSAGRKRFLLLHTYEIHDPYIHTELAEGLPAGRVEGYFDRWMWERLRHDFSAEEKTYVEALYDGGIAFTDRHLGALFDELERRGVFERAIVIVTSDHGEQFFEHGYWRHGQNLYDHQLLVPLIVHLPPALAEELGVERRGVLRDQVQLSDLYPTLLELLRLEAPGRVNGLSLLPVLAGERLPRRDAFAEDVNVKTLESKALRTRRFKYVHNFPVEAAGDSGGGESVELYDLARDPGEQLNLAADDPERVASFEALLQAILGSGGGLRGTEEVPEEIDPELRKRLEALGYIGN